MNYLKSLEVMVAALGRNNVDVGTINAIVADVVLADRDEKVARATDRATVQAGRLIDHLTVRPIEVKAKFDLDTHHKRGSVIRRDALAEQMEYDRKANERVAARVNPDHTSTNLVPEWTADEILRSEG